MGNAPMALSAIHWLPSGPGGLLPRGLAHLPGVETWKLLRVDGGIHRFSGQNLEKTEVFTIKI